MDQNRGAPRRRYRRRPRRLRGKLRRRFPFISESLARHYARTYGSNSEWILKEASALSDLGEDFGHEFYEAELKYLVEHEWVRSLDDASGVVPNRACG